MSITTILEMAVSARDGPAITADGRSVSAAELLDLALGAASVFREYPAVVYLGTSGVAYPVALFGAALAGVPFIPLNYRLGSAGRRRCSPVTRGPGTREDDLDGLLGPAGSPAAPGATRPGRGPRRRQGTARRPGRPVAAILYTSGTTAEPKAALLRHRHLLAYVLNTVEFGRPRSGDATLVAVPPYHIAGLANLLTNMYAGRRVVYLAAFDPASGWGRPREGSPTRWWCRRCWPGS